MVAEYVPAGIISLKPGLVPSGALVAEVLDLGGAIVAWPAAASRPLKGPICTRPAYFGPERQPFPTEYACHSCQPSRAALDIVLIASANGWHGIDGLVALRSVAVRRAMTWLKSCRWGSSSHRDSCWKRRLQLLWSWYMWCRSCEKSLPGREDLLHRDKRLDPDSSSKLDLLSQDFRSVPSRLMKREH